VRSDRTGSAILLLAGIERFDSTVLTLRPGLWYGA
jgi:hypothetical protein